MKKRLLAMLLVLMMLVSLLPSGVLAASGAYCGEGNHTPDLATKQPANWNNVTGGYEYEYYTCSVCGTLCHSPSATDAQYVGHANKGHTPDTARGLNQADYDPVTGGYEEANYYCVGNEPGGACTERVKADGTIVPFKNGSGQVCTHGTLTEMEANYYPCSGGFKDTYWQCGCGKTFADDKAKTEIQRSGPASDGKHTPDTDQPREADYTSCLGGVQEVCYPCQGCDKFTDQQGDEVQEYTGDGQHQFTGDWIPAAPVCMEGPAEEHRVCELCHHAFNKDGNLAADNSAQPHTANMSAGVVLKGYEDEETVYPCVNDCGHYYITATEKWFFYEGGSEGGEGGSECSSHEPNEDGWQDENYYDCTGGMVEKFFVCKHCDACINEKGEPAAWGDPKPGAGHTPGNEKFPAFYSPCVGGGIETDYYECTQCHRPVDAQGNELEPKEVEISNVHVPGKEKQDSNYTACGGGINSEYYLCVGCWEPVDADGKLLEAAAGDGNHTIELIDEVAPTFEEYGIKAHYECALCGTPFVDAEGKTLIDESNAHLYIIDRLTKTEITEGVATPPAGKTETEVKEDLENAALKADVSLTAADSKSVLLDVTLTRMDDDGNVVEVTEDDFPAEGVTVLLPYPNDVDENNYKQFNFVVTHMKHDGTVEVMKNAVPGESGITVVFMSLSPVMITYQEKKETVPTPTPDYKITDATANQTLTPENSKNGASFVSTADFADFKEVRVDGKAIDAANYDVVSGSTKVTLKKAYLDTLAYGAHTVEIVSEGGSAKTAFTKTGNPVAVKFDVNGGTTPAPASISVTPGLAYGTLPTATHTSLYFAGWYTAKTGGTRVYSTSVVSADEAHTLYAHWSTVPLTGDTVTAAQVTVLGISVMLSLTALAVLMAYKKRNS